MSPQLIIIFILFGVLVLSVLFSFSRRSLKVLAFVMITGVISGMAVWGVLDLNDVSHRFAKQPKLYVFEDFGVHAAFAGLGRVYTIPEESTVQLRAQIEAGDFSSLGKRYYKVVVLKPELFGSLTDVRFGEDVFSKHELLSILRSPAAKQEYFRAVQRKKSVRDSEQLMLAVNSAFQTNEALKSALLVVLYNAAIGRSSLFAEINKGAVDVRPVSFTFFVIENLPSQLVRGDYFELNG
ncbi:MAG: hypothetical protein HY363_02270 [Candidatus Aenigmarchaeota archaeon]|nr:hypothetical protein [Candidatus Aenigmarchaeota archaeon]